MSQHNRANERRTSDGEHGGAQDNDDRTADTVGPGAGDLSSELGILSALIAASAGNGQGGHGGISRDGQQGGSISIHDLIRFLVSNRGSTTTGGPVIHFDEDEEDGDYVPGEHDDDDEYEDEEDDEDEDDYQDEGYSYWGRRHFNNVGHHFPRVTEPQAAGLKLLYSGEFGPPPPGPVVNAKPEEPKSQSRRATRRTRRPLEQEPAPEANQYPAYHTAYRLPLLPIRKPFAPHNSRAETARGLVPNSPGAVVAQYEDKVYSGQFSLDANIFYSCTQGHSIWVYDANSTGNKKIVDPTTGVASRMKILNRLSGVYGNWTVTDSHLSPDNERLIYSSISPIVYLTKLQEPGAQHIPLDFSGTTRRGRRGVFYDDTFGIWTCRFSADGKEVVACGSQQIFVWDLAANKRIVNIPAHQQDVNSCCWADTSSGNILVSGSDDAMIKIWDRRSLSSNRPSGVLPGHLEGITSVSAKGDGRYIISNGKDHALRLWDLRNMREHEDVDYRPHGQRGYDYRYGGYRKPKKGAHPNDCSVMTYRGHSVFRTLIRCHFSPAETTGQAYVYSGSTDGKVYIWSLDGRIVETIDRTQSLPISFDSRDPDLPERTQHNRGHNDKIIRDCSWHPREPALLSCYWDSGESSSIARHEWKSLGKRGMTLEDVMEKNRAEAEERERMARLPGHYEL